MSFLIMCYNNNVNNTTRQGKNMNKITIKILFLLLVIVISGCGANKDNQQDLKTLDIKGSDTLLQVVSSMAEAFNEKNLDAEVTVTGGGSGTGIASLLNGEIFLANSSRDVKEQEIKAAADKGKEFKKFIVARDGISIIANKNNPVKKLTIADIGRIFRGEIKNWKEIGGDDSAINLYGRQSTSGTYEYMKDEILKGDYDPSMRNMEGNKAIIDAVIGDKTGIGYTGIAYAAMEKGNISILDIAGNYGEEYASPLKEENIVDGKYPLTRPLYQIMLGVPVKNSLIYEFLKFEESEEGEKIIYDSGYYKPNADDIKVNRELLNN